MFRSLIRLDADFHLYSPVGRALVAKGIVFEVFCRVKREKDECDVSSLRKLHSL